MNLQQAVQTIAAHDERRQRARKANRELCQMVEANLTEFQKVISQLGSAVTKVQDHVRTLCEGMDEDLNDEDLPTPNSMRDTDS